MAGLFIKTVPAAAYFFKKIYYNIISHIIYYIMDINLLTPCQKVGGSLIQTTEKYEFSAAKDRTPRGLNKPQPQTHYKTFFKNWVMVVITITVNEILR